MAKPTKGYLARMVAAGTLFAVVAMTSASCNPEPPPKPTSNWTIERARTFQEFPLYWLGDSYQGAPLTSIRLTTDGDGVTHASFSYGEPTYAGDAASGSWLAPLEVDIQPYCGFSPEEFLSFEDDYGTDPIAVEVRTVNGYLRRYSSTDSYLTLWTGGSSINMSTWKSEVDVEVAAEALIPIASRSGAALQSLPAPTSALC